jgi:hypothetical protein
MASVFRRVKGGVGLCAFKNHRCFHGPRRNHRLLHIINHSSRVMDHRLKDGLCTLFQFAHPAAITLLADAPCFEVFPAVAHRRVAAKRPFDFGRPILRHGLNYPDGPKVFSVKLFPGTEDALSHTGQRNRIGNNLRITATRKEKKARTASLGSCSLPLGQRRIKELQRAECA